ncbi:MAG: SRPBCC family protein [Jatrophihabitantaceae bacterium]
MPSVPTGTPCREQSAVTTAQTGSAHAGPEPIHRPCPDRTGVAALLDVERLAQCPPVRRWTARTVGTFRGPVKVKVGPIQLAYRGEATITEQDDAAHGAVIHASGKQTRGSGDASAGVVAELSEHDGQTRVEVHTELELSGKPAQFGRSIIGEVSSRLLDQFAGNRAHLLAGPDEVQRVRRFGGGAPGPVEPGSRTAVRSTCGHRCHPWPAVCCRGTVPALLVASLAARRLRRRNR